MRNFALGVISGMVIAGCCYRPYQIEAEYRQNVAAGLGTPSPVPHCTVTIVRSDLLVDGTPVEMAGENGKTGTSTHYSPQ
jgi:hypothetical protein